MKTVYTFKLFSLIILFSILFTNHAYAAGFDSTRTDKSIIINYWGTLDNNPGIKLGLEKTRRLSTQYAVNSSIAVLLNRKPAICTSAGIVLNSSLRKTGKRGVYFEHGINFGYLGSYYDFDLYTTNSDHEIVNVGQKWISSIILGYSFGLGYDFSKNTKLNAQIFIKPGIYFRSPNHNNLFYLNNYSIDIGFSFQPKWMNKIK